MKITDFGLARAVDDASLTQSGVVAGTPLFMAPEQARSETIDHRADLFSLGAVLYAMCTGRSPFRAPTTLAVLRRVCDDAPRPVREVNRDIPDWLAAIIDRLLAKEPASRYQNASEVAELLGRHLARQTGIRSADENEPRAILAPTLVEDVGPPKKSNRRRRLIELIGYMVVLLAGLFVLTEVIGVTNILRYSGTRVGQQESGGQTRGPHLGPERSRRAQREYIPSWSRHVPLPLHPLRLHGRGVQVGPESLDPGLRPRARQVGRAGG